MFDRLVLAQKVAAFVSWKSLNGEFEITFTATKGPRANITIF